MLEESNSYGIAPSNCSVAAAKGAMVIWQKAKDVAAIGAVQVSAELRSNRSDGCFGVIVRYVSQRDLFRLEW